MKKCIVVIIYFLLTAVSLTAKNRTIDSLTALLNKHPQEDTVQVNLLNQLAHQLQILGSEKTVSIAEAALRLSRTLNYVPGEILAFSRTGSYYLTHGNYGKALQ